MEKSELFKRSSESGTGQAISLVGHTGFVGSNIYASAGQEIDAVYNSKNIKDAYGTRPGLLIYAGMRGTKFLANDNPAKDWDLTVQAEENIASIAPGRLVLISTVDVFKEPKGVDENSPVETRGLHAYGYNRYQLELWVREHYPDALIIRLPALFGKNIKKNFIYDIIHVIPPLLRTDKMEELSDRDKELKNYYKLLDNGFYGVRELSPTERELLKERFRKLSFSALDFTDSRSRYQFYDLRRLWLDIQTALLNGLTLWHPATEPISAGELYEYITGRKFVNELNGSPVNYDYRTAYSEFFHGSGNYICGKAETLARIKAFVEESAWRTIGGVGYISP